jgi:hypothetical protein
MGNPFPEGRIKWKRVKNKKRSFGPRSGLLELGAMVDVV